MARKIQLKITKMVIGQDEENNDVEKDFNYSDALMAVLKTPGPGGLTMDEIEKNVPIMKKIKKVGKGVDSFITLEEEEWDHLKKKLKEFRGWAHSNEVLRDFGKAIKEAESVTL